MVGGRVGPGGVGGVGGAWGGGNHDKQQTDQNEVVGGSSDQTWPAVIDISDWLTFFAW